MAIRSYTGEKLTPKQLAQDLLMTAAGNAGYALEDHEGLTEREKVSVYEHIEKQYARMGKLFGYSSPWKLG